jgi:2-polyprenyl-3-methyl-5-hydroxy-6-metoxy-1,4-benzoquinol methylase
MMEGFLARFDALRERSGASDVHEVGCGEGELSIRMARAGIAVRGTDFSEKIIAEARSNAAGASVQVPFRVASIYDLEPERDAASLIVCCEVLEHLEEPERALDVLAGLARPHLLVSVPREPVWRTLNMVRGKYLRSWGNTPGHFQHWSKRDFFAFVKTRFEVVEEDSPFPWTMALCRVPSFDD